MIKAIVTDIEGTTSALSFVKDVLFPYAREHLAEYVRDHAHDARVTALLDDVRKEAGEPLNREQLISRLIRWIDEDKKVTPLKALQGLIWEAGYRQGHYQGHIYRDAVEQLQTWKRQGLALYVYSSGSVFAQKLLFTHTEYGDLTPLFSGYFDTHIGAKKEIASYREIARQLVLAPTEIVFLSDIKEELDAAKAAGLKTVWLNRDGQLDERAEHRQVADFYSINF